MAKSNKTNDKIVWLDMEMTGLDPDADHILEIACLVTDKNLNKISKPFHAVLYQPQARLNEMDDWCMEHHGKSGLIKESLASKMNIKEADELLLKFLEKYTYPGGCPLAGNSVYMDKLFMMKHMPKACNYLHYRIIDVTSIDELCRRWFPNFRKNTLKKKSNHRALSDIEDSINQLKYLRTNYFLPKKNYHQHNKRPEKQESDDSIDSLDAFGSL